MVFEIQQRIGAARLMNSRLTNRVRANRRHHLYIDGGIQIIQQGIPKRILPLPLER
jgi:hypothetical protein